MKKCTQTVLGASARLCLAAIALLVSAGPVIAQTGQLLPPENEDGIKGRTWISGFISVFLLSLVVFASFMKSKRGHED